MLVIGTSAQVAPACDLPRIAKEQGAFLIEINTEATALTSSVTDLHIAGTASSVISGLAGEVRRRVPGEARGPKIP
jgi:NAD-dependent deacetylase